MCIFSLDQESDRRHNIVIILSNNIMSMCIR